MRVVAVDNLMRRGSELNLPRLAAAGVEFVHGDVRYAGDLARVGEGLELLIECAAEPSVLAGYGQQTDYVIQTNLVGTTNGLDLARRSRADVIFLSTSRVYPVRALNEIAVEETETRFAIGEDQRLPGISRQGISEDFPLQGARSLYGTSKLCSELMLHEYADMFGLRFIVNRCSVLAGPWQMGKVDQGVFALWAARHLYGKGLAYIGWGGRGKQVRDVLHIDDLAELVALELTSFDRLNGSTFNVGGGPEGAVSLLETTRLCRAITGCEVPVESEPRTRAGDVKLYVTDNTRVTQATGWAPRRTPADTLESIVEWLRDAGEPVRRILG